MNEFSKVAGYKIYITRAIVFLFTIKENLKMKIR